MKIEIKGFKRSFRAGRQITAVVADKSSADLRAVCQTLRVQWDIKIVAAVNNGLNAVRETTLLRPDLVVLNVDMPEFSGPEAAAIIGANYKDTSVILMVNSGECERQKRWRGCGAAAFILKSNFLTMFRQRGSFPGIKCSPFGRGDRKVREFYEPG
jgi:DNA-binding NarL/FixJ family response regulator